MAFPTMCRLCVATPVCAAAALAQHRVRRGRAIARDDVKRLIGLERPAQLVEQIEQLRIDGLLFVDAEIAEQVIQLRQRLGLVLAVAAVHQPQSLTRVGVKERERAVPLHGRRPHGGLRTARHQRRNGGGGANAAEEGTAVQDGAAVRSRRDWTSWKHASGGTTCLEWLSGLVNLRYGCTSIEPCRVAPGKLVRTLNVS